MSLKIERIGAQLQITNSHGRVWNITASALDGDLAALGQLVLAISDALAPSEVQFAKLLGQGRLSSEEQLRAHAFTTDALAAALAQGLVQKSEITHIAGADAPHWRRHDRELAKIAKEQSAQALLDELLADCELSDDGIIARQGKN